MLKKEKSASLYHKNRKTDLNDSQNGKIENPNVPLHLPQLVTRKPINLKLFLKRPLLFYQTESSDSELEEDESVQEGVYYLLKELAFIISSKEIFGTNKIAVIYHRSWPVYEKFVNGDYDGEAKEGLGLAIINYDLCC